MYFHKFLLGSFICPTTLHVGEDGNLGTKDTRSWMTPEVPMWEDF